jgi:hypothetical protein
MKSDGEKDVLDQSGGGGEGRKNKSRARTNLLKFSGGDETDIFLSVIAK